MRDDIVGMLKNAIEHGGNPARVAQSLINSGYPLKDVQEALNYVTQGYQPASSAVNASSTPQVSQPVRPAPQPMPRPQPLQQAQVRQQMPHTPEYRPQTAPLNPLKQLSISKSKPPTTSKLVIMFSILAILILALLGVIIFKDQILDMLG